MSDYNFARELVKRLELDKSELSIEPFRQHDYTKKYFKEGTPILVGLTSHLTKMEFSSGMFSLPEKFVTLFNNGEKELDTRDVSYPVAQS